MTILLSLLSASLLLGLPDQDSRAAAPSSVPCQLARKAKSAGPEVRKKIDVHLRRAAQMILLRRQQLAMREVEAALRLDPKNERARAYRLVLGELMELQRPPTRPNSRPSTRPSQNPATGRLNGTPGNWRACRGTGAHVCIEKIPPGYGKYWQNHPRCIPNKACQGSFFTCNKACPPLSEADRD